MRKTFTTLAALTLLAVTGGIASASDNGDGARTLAEIRAVQQNSQRAATSTSLDQYQAMAGAARQQAPAVESYEYRGSAR